MPKSKVTTVSGNTATATVATKDSVSTPYDEKFRAVGRTGNPTERPVYSEWGPTYDDAVSDGVALFDEGCVEFTVQRVYVNPNVTESESDSEE